MYKYTFCTITIQQQSNIKRRLSNAGIILIDNKNATLILDRYRRCSWSGLVDMWLLQI